MIETIIFDMDGVIIDSEPIHLELQQELFQRYSVQLTKHEYQQFIGRSSKNMWEELVSRFDIQTSVDQILLQDRALYHQRLKTEPDLAPIPGVRELIETLSLNHKHLILASSSSMESIKLVLELFELTNFFDHRVSGADLRYSKPHPEIFQVAASLTGSDPNSCLVIEDSNHGVTAAKKAQMKCLGYQNLNSGVQDLSKADLIIDDFRAISYDQIMEIGAKS